MPPRPRSYEETAHRRAFGERVRVLRVERGWSQEDLAERADPHRTYVVGMERGHRNASLDVIVRVAEALGVSVRDLYRRGRVIIGRPLGYRPQNIFGEARNDPLNQRVYGQLNLNDFPVNHLKDDFLWDGREDDFQQKLRETVLDYIDFARRYRPSKAGKAGGPSSATVATTNDEMADELSDDEMAEQLEVVEIMEVPDEPDPALIEAKAARLRAQKIEPRIVEVGNRTFRIYHPEKMPDGDPYYFRQSANDDVIDIFINDNHPFVAAKANDENSYVMFVRMCIMDAIVEHSLLHKGGNFTATFPARLKDQLLRGVKV